MIIVSLLTPSQRTQHARPYVYRTPAPLCERERKQRESNDLVALAAARGPRYKVTSCRMGWVSLSGSHCGIIAHIYYFARRYFFALSHLQQSLSFSRKASQRRACNLFTSFWLTNFPQIIHSQKVLLHHLV